MSNKENLQKFVDALRSGEYLKTRGCLQEDGQYCVWGVGCEVFRKETGQGKWRRTSPPRRWRFNDNAYGPPQEVLEWYGLEDERVNQLIWQNDYLSMSFQELADFIERELMP